MQENLIKTRTSLEFKIRLNAEIEIAKSHIVYDNRRSKFFKSKRRTTLPGFVKVSDDKTLSDENCIQLVALHKFIEREKWLNDDEIMHLIVSSKDEFPFLNDVITTLPDAIDDLRIHGAQYIALAYRQRKYTDARMAEFVGRAKEFFQSGEQDVNVAK